jgi:hypothetical protein
MEVHLEPQNNQGISMFILCSSSAFIASNTLFFALAVPTYDTIDLPNIAEEFLDFSNKIINQII